MALCCDCCLGGGLVTVAAGDVVVMPYPGGGEVYSIKGPLFDETYALEDPQSRVPTYEELQAEWSPMLNGEGRLHQKSEVVYVEAAGEHHDPVVQTTVDEHGIELSISVIWNPRDTGRSIPGV